MRCAGAALFTFAVLAAPCAGAGEDVPVLTREHRHPSGVFTFRTPDGWALEPGPKPSVLVVRAAAPAPGARLHVVFEPRDLGYDSLHVSCMDQRLLGPMETEPQVKYEYDFLSAELGGARRMLDSAFVVRYDREVDGAREWRQRNFTVAGPQEALCLIVHAPLRLWKKSAAARRLLDAVVESLRFADAPAPTPAP